MPDERCEICGAPLAYLGTVFLWMEPSTDTGRTRTWSGPGCVEHPDVYIDNAVELILADYDEVVDLARAQIVHADDLVEATRLAFAELERLEQLIGAPDA